VPVISKSDLLSATSLSFYDIDSFLPLIFLSLPLSSLSSYDIDSFLPFISLSLLPSSCRSTALTAIYLLPFLHRHSSISSPPASQLSVIACTSVNCLPGRAFLCTLCHPTSRSQLRTQTLSLTHHLLFTLRRIHGKASFEIFNFV
jgi:hypothetical protein